MKTKAHTSSVFQEISRRTLLRGAGAVVAGSALTGLSSPAIAQSRTIKIGLVMPQTGPLAFFSEHVEFVFGQLERAFGGTIDVDGRQIAYEIITRDSQSNPNRASEVASELILNDGVDMMLAAATPETTVPVSDVCELNGIPCLTNDTPIEPYFEARGGDPKKGFDWTNHYFFTGSDAGGSILNMFQQIESNKNVGVLWANDGDGITYSKIQPPILNELGFSVTDPGRFDMPLSSYAAIVRKFREAEAELVWGVIPPPDFTTFWNEAAQQRYQPKFVYCGKTNEFPAALEPFGERAYNMTTEIWWAPQYPYSSTLTGQTSAELAAEYETESGRQWSMPLGFRHSIFEVAFDALKRTENLDDPASIQAAISTTDMVTVCGPVNFSTGPLPNTSATPLAGGQWVPGDKYLLDLVITENAFAPDVDVQAQTQPMKYT